MNPKFLTPGIRIGEKRARKGNGKYYGLFYLQEVNHTALI